MSKWLSVMLYLCDMTRVQVIVGDVVPVFVLLAGAAQLV